jgi:NADPH-dependent ferric siderophore reductase
VTSSDQPVTTARIRRAVVTGVRHLSPGMVRVTFGGDDLADLVSTGVGDEYVRLFFPHPGEQDVVMPFVSGEYWDYPEGVVPGPMRAYTIRAIPEPGVLVIDFVVHEGGVAAAWALAARPGDVLALNPPRGLYAPPEGMTWQLLLADATGLPALARILETTDPAVRTRAVVQVADPAHRLDLVTPSGVDVVWTTGGNGHGPCGLLDALRATPLPEDGTGYVWFAGETRVQRAVRKHLRHERGLPGTAYKVVGYWTHAAEEWAATWDGLGPEVRERLDTLWSDPTRDPEAVADDVDALYAEVGL